MLGRAVIYNAWTQIGPDSWGWKERIAPGALTDSLSDDGIYSTFNHDADNLLGRVSNETLRMTDSAADALERSRSTRTSIPKLGVRCSPTSSGRMCAGCRSPSAWTKPTRWKGRRRKTDMDRMTITRRPQLYELGPVVNPAYTADLAHNCGVRLTQIVKHR